MRKPLQWTAIAVAAGVGIAVLALAFADWDRLRGPIAKIASSKSGRPVQIAGHLDVDLFSWNPQATIEGLRIGNPSWVRQDAPLLANVERVTIQVSLASLFKGHLELPLLKIEQPDVFLLKDAAGRANWAGEVKRRGAKAGKPADLPLIRRLVLNNGRVQLFDEQRKVHFNGMLAADEAAGEVRSGAAAMPFRLEGEGQLNRKPFMLHVRAGSLVNVNRDQPYPFEASMRAGDTRLKAAGSIRKPFDMGTFQATLAMSGDDLADLYYLTGLALPNTPPYKASGTLARNDTRFDFSNVAGFIGDSDVHGAVSVELGRERPFLTATLTSKTLDIDDLAAPLGAAPSVKPGETASPKEKKVAQAMQANQRLLPDATLQADRLRGMDGVFNYSADSVKTHKLPLKRVSAKVNLEKGVLTIDPMAFDLPQGRLTGNVRLDARGDTPKTAVDVRLSGVQLAQFRPKDATVSPIEGLLLARAKLQGTGESVHQAASTSNGTLTVVVPRGEVRAALAELTGINVTRGLGLLIRNDQEHTPVRCGVADFAVAQGKMSAKHLVFDTKDVLITGKGSVDLETEGLDLTIRGEPKKLRLVRLRSPVTIQGPLRKPDIGIQTGKAIAQGGVGVALASLVAPLAAVIAFVDPGLAKDADCGALLAEAGAKSTGVKTADSSTAAIR